jgi:hypothetical protein
MATKRQRNYVQMGLPFDLAELRKPVKPYLPPGLREFATADKLTDEQVRQLAQVYPTIRGRKPVNAAEWRDLWRIIVSVEKEQFGNEHRKRQSRS